MTDASPLFRRVLGTFPAYRPGKVPVPAPGQAEAHKLSSNESPYGPLPSVAEVIAEAGRGVNRYPDNGAEALTSALAARFAVPSEHIAVGCGSVGVLKQVIESVADRGAEVLYAWRSFEAYPPLCDLAGATSVRVPLRGETHDLDAMAAAITPRTRAVLVCNPNNPTGTTVAGEELTAFLDRVPEDCLVVLDEAYREYVRDEATPDGIEPVPGPPQRGGAPHVLQGVRPGRAARRVPGRAPAGRRGRPQDDAALHGELDRPGGCCRLA